MIGLIPSQLTYVFGELRPKNVRLWDGMRNVEIMSSVGPNEDTIVFAMTIENHSFVGLGRNLFRF